MERPYGGLVKHAAEAASRSTGVRKVRVGSAALVGGSIYRGWNSLHTHPFAVEYSKNSYAHFLHAEVAALIACKWRATQLVVVRVCANGQWGNARPCSGCQRAIAAVKGLECWYSVGDGERLEKLGS